MNPGSGTDVAQTIRLGDSEEGGQFNLQWNDPYDLNGATYGNPLFTASGNLTTPTSSQTFTYNASSAQVGKQLEFRTDGVPSGTTDLVLEVTDPDGNSSGEIDTGTSPEAYVTTIKKAGAYKITDHRLRRRHRPVHRRRPPGALAVQGHHRLQRAALRRRRQLPRRRRRTTTRSAAVPMRSPGSADRVTSRW